MPLTDGPVFEGCLILETSPALSGSVRVQWDYLSRTLVIYVL